MRRDSGNAMIIYRSLSIVSSSLTVLLIGRCFNSGDFQQFDASSDEDFGDKGPRRASNSGKSKRVKECPGCGANVAVSTKECRFCDYQFTSKSLLVNQQSAAQESQAIRDRFPFEPERVSCWLSFCFVFVSVAMKSILGT